MADPDRKKLTLIQGKKNKFTLKKSIILLSILILLFFSGQRFVKIHEQKEALEQLKIQLEKEKEKSSKLEEEIEKLQSPEGIERIAREQLGLVKENEVLVKPIILQGDKDKDNEDEGQDEDEQTGGK